MVVVVVRGVVVDNRIVDIVVVSGGGVAVIVVFFGFSGAKITNFNTRKRVMAKIVKTIKHMPMILTQRRCHHLRRPLFAVADSLNTWLLCILFSKRNFYLSLYTYDLAKRRNVYLSIHCGLTAWLDEKNTCI